MNFLFSPNPLIPCIWLNFLCRDRQHLAELLSSFLTEFRKMVTMDARLKKVLRSLNEIHEHLSLAPAGVLAFVKDLYPDYEGNTGDAQYILYGSYSAILMRYLTIVECYLRTLDPRVLDAVIGGVIQLHESSDRLEEFQRELVEKASEQVTPQKKPNNEEKKK